MASEIVYSAKTKKTKVIKFNKKKDAKKIATHKAQDQEDTIRMAEMDTRMKYLEETETTEFEDWKKKKDKDGK